MNSEEFLKKLEIELKISKNSVYTIRNYVDANKQLFDALALLKSEKDKSALQADKNKNELSRLNQSHAAALTEMQRELEEARRKACEPVYDLNEIPTIVLFEEWGKRIWTAIKSIVKK